MWRLPSLQFVEPAGIRIQSPRLEIPVGESLALASTPQHYEGIAADRAPLIDRHRADDVAAEVLNELHAAFPIGPVSKHGSEWCARAERLPQRVGDARIRPTVLQLEHSRGKAPSG